MWMWVARADLVLIDVGFVPWLHPVVQVRAQAPTTLRPSQNLTRASRARFGHPSRSSSLVEDYLLTRSSCEPQRLRKQGARVPLPSLRLGGWCWRRLRGCGSWATRSEVGG